MAGSATGGSASAWYILQSYCGWGFSMVYTPVLLWVGLQHGIYSSPIVGGASAWYMLQSYCGWGLLVSECMSQYLRTVHKVHPFLDDPQLFYRFADKRPPAELSSSASGGRLQQLMSLFSFGRTSTPSGSPTHSPAPHKQPLSGGEGLSYLTNGRPRFVRLE